MVLFEVPTGIVADTVGRRASYLLGTVTLAVSTLLYVLLWQVGAPFAAWAVVSILIGLGFTFFSGAVEAWLVDVLGCSSSHRLLVFAQSDTDLCLGWEGPVRPLRERSKPPLRSNPCVPWQRSPAGGVGLRDGHPETELAGADFPLRAVG
jgi:hypothetical protein